MFMRKPDGGPKKKPYEKPTATKLATEQAKLKLLGHVIMGGFSETFTKDSKAKTQSA